MALISSSDLSGPPASSDDELRWEAIYLERRAKDSRRYENREHRTERSETAALRSAPSEPSEPAAPATYTDQWGFTKTYERRSRLEDMTARLAPRSHRKPAKPSRHKDGAEDTTTTANGQATPHPIKRRYRRSK